MIEIGQPSFAARRAVPPDRSPPAARCRLEEGHEGGRLATPNGCSPHAKFGAVPPPYLKCTSRVRIHGTAVIYQIIHDRMTKDDHPFERYSLSVGHGQLRRRGFHQTMAPTRSAGSRARESIRAGGRFARFSPETSRQFTERLGIAERTCRGAAIPRGRPTGGCARCRIEQEARRPRARADVNQSSPRKAMARPLRDRAVRLEERRPIRRLGAAASGTTTVPTVSRRSQ